MGETTEQLERARLLPAYVEIMLAAGETAPARDACRELAEGDARAALIALRHACQVWQQLEAPYEVAVVRALMGLACRALGDDDGAGLELEAARDVFLQLGAVSDVARVDSLTRDARPTRGLLAESHHSTTCSA